MKSSQTNAEKIEHLLYGIRKQDEARYLLVDRLRKIVLASHASIKEEVKYGGILFSAGPPLCGIFSYPSHVSLEFGRGAELPDKHQVLEGEGKNRRHIKLEGPQDLFKKNIREYVLLVLAAAAQYRSTGPGAKTRH